MIQGERIVSLNKPSTGGKYILLWIQQAQRTRFNHALEFAVRQANELRVPLFACFVITDGFPGQISAITHSCLRVWKRWRKT
ncbi:MAG: hypothetical protein LRY51_06355 [Geovibrio sp.]|nr:hypothetical protein [Geovibrio sp.]